MYCLLFCCIFVFLLNNIRKCTKSVPVRNTQVIQGSKRFCGRINPCITWKAWNSQNCNQRWCMKCRWFLWGRNWGRSAIRLRLFNMSAMTHADANITHFCVYKWFETCMWSVWSTLSYSIQIQWFSHIIVFKVPSKHRFPIFSTQTCSNSAISRENFLYMYGAIGVCKKKERFFCYNWRLLCLGRRLIYPTFCFQWIAGVSLFTFSNMYYHSRYLYVIFARKMTDFILHVMMSALSVSGRQRSTT